MQVNSEMIESFNLIFIFKNAHALGTYFGIRPDESIRTGLARRNHLNYSLDVIINFPN